jgi:hypothetical protein
MSYQPLFLGLGTAVVRTTAATNFLEGETANLRVGQPVVTRQESTTHVFGGVTANTIYYIREIVDANNFKISLTINGDPIVLQDGQGFMLFRAVQREMVGESLRKVDTMLEEIYSSGIGGGGIGGDIDGGDADSSFNDSTGGSGGISSVIEDETPSLGGNLLLNGNDIVGTGNINISGSINATVLSGGFRGVLAGSLTGPVDDQGARTGNPTIDGLPFELGNPQAGQVIAWDGPNAKFVLTSPAAVSVDNISLDDVLFNGNTSSNSITVSSLTTDSLVLPNGLNYSVIVNPPTIPTDISDLTDNTSLLGPSLSVITPDDIEISDVATIVFTGTGVTASAVGNAVTLDITGGASADIGDFTFTNSTASIPLGDTLVLQTNQSGGNRESVLTLNPTADSALDVGSGLRVRTNYGTGFEKSWTFNTDGSVTFPDATVQSTAYTGGNVSGLGSREILTATTGALAINSVGNISITGFKTYALLAMIVEIPAWVRVYASAAARTADAARLETEDPLPGSGVIAEVITTTDNQTVLFTPATIGFNAETPAANTVYLAVKNKGTGVATIDVTLILVQLEA